MIKVSYLEQQDATLEFDILEQTLQRLRSWLQIRVNMQVNNKASVIEKPFIHSPTTNNDLNDEA